MWVAVVEGNAGQNRLLKELFETRHYDKDALPVTDLSEPTIAEFGIVLLKIVQVVCVSYKKPVSYLSLSDCLSIFIRSNHS